MAQDSQGQQLGGKFSNLVSRFPRPHLQAFYVYALGAAIFLELAGGVLFVLGSRLGAFLLVRCFFSAVYCSAGVVCQHAAPLVPMGCALVLATRDVGQHLLRYRHRVLRYTP